MLADQGVRRCEAANVEMILGETGSLARKRMKSGQARSSAQCRLRIFELTLQCSSSPGRLVLLRLPLSAIRRTRWGAGSNGTARAMPVYQDQLACSAKKTAAWSPLLRKPGRSGGTWSRGAIVPEEATFGIDRGRAFTSEIPRSDRVRSSPAPVPAANPGLSIKPASPQTS
jgi:hypothetical protein